MIFVLGLLVSPSGLQKLLDICVRFGFDNDIIYTSNTSMCMIFKPPSYSGKCPPMYLGNDTLDYVDLMISIPQ